MFSRLYATLEPRLRRLVAAAAVSGLLFLISTVKIAAFVGLAVAASCYVVASAAGVRRKAGILVWHVAVVVGVAYMVLSQFSVGWYEWFQYKVWTRWDELQGSGFLAENLAAAVQAFRDNPMFGSGIGAFHGYYGEYEVHSTYFKMLGEGGLVGFFAYCVFLAAMIKTFRNVAGKGGPVADYLQQVVPFGIGCLVSWGYTYHLRKREFWVALSTVWLARRLVRRQSSVPSARSAKHCTRAGVLSQRL